MVLPSSAVLSSEGSRLESVDLDVSNARHLALLRYRGWTAYVGFFPALACLAFLAVFLLRPPPASLYVAILVVYVIPLTTLGSVLLILSLCAVIPGLHLFPAQRRFARASVVRITGDARALTFLKGDGTSVTCSLLDPNASIRLARELTPGPGRPRPKLPPSLFVRFAKEVSISAPLTPQAFDAVRWLILASGLDTFEEEHEHFPWTPGWYLWAGMAARIARDRSRRMEQAAHQRSRQARGASFE